mmetsp:Transcript_36565/g.91680  ORF Transcript_36565/g.91680 Transcript_36565/m.91680 type:complete len:218 (-) Transcript_36565:23-676(-)
MYHFNPIRLLADFMHLASIWALLHKMNSTKSCAGVSLKTQYLYATVFTCRYLDLFVYFTASMYNTTMKIIFIASSLVTIHLMRTKFRATYDRAHDNFRIIFLIVPCAVLALIFNYEFEFLELLWTFSIYLEAVAMMPQLFLLQRTGGVDVMTLDYIFCLGGYRALYLINWIYRVMTEDDYSDWIVWIAGCLQTALYADFFYYYFKSKWYGKKLTLPN